MTRPEAGRGSAGHAVRVTTAPESEVAAAGHRKLTIVPIASGLGGFVRPIVEIVFAQLVVAHAIESKDFTLDDFLYTQDDTKVAEESVA